MINHDPITPIHAIDFSNYSPEHKTRRLLSYAVQPSAIK